MERRRIVRGVKWLVVVTACFWMTLAPVSDRPASAGVAGFVPLTPLNGDSLTQAPHFSWSPGDYNLFLFYSVFDYAGFGYVPIAFWMVETGFQMPQTWWDAVEIESPCAWVVIGVNTTTLSYEVSSVSEFTKAKVPVLVSPEDGAEDLDNSCLPVDGEQTDSIEWDFEWEVCPGATKYNIRCKNLNAQNPVLDVEVDTNSYHHTNSGIIPEENRRFWGWKVRAADEQGVWGPWSEEWFFSVEPLGTDCP